MVTRPFSKIVDRVLLCGAGLTLLLQASVSAQSGGIPADRTTVWAPGIPGGIPTYTTNVTTIDAATYGNGVTDASAAINAALATSGTAASPRVVYLPPGTYRIADFIRSSARYVVLRGAGPTATKLRGDNPAAPVIRLGNYDWQGATVLNIVGSVPRGSTQMTVSNAAGLRVGDIVQIDQLDDPAYVFLFDAIYSKRGPAGNNSGPVSAGRTGHSGYRSVAEQKEIVAIAGNVVTFSPATRIAFAAAWAPQVWKVIDGPSGTGQSGVHGVGVEDLYVTGGGNDQIQFLGAAYSWIRNVESDGDPATGIGSAGRHFWFVHGFRNEIRRTYVHHAAHIGQGGGAYGISLGVSTSDCLVEDNIAVCLNKAILTEVSGGGNVFAYNYIDNVKTDLLTWMEGAADGSHQAYSHGDLWEGNAAANLGCDTTHGSSGGLTFFRNRAFGRCSDPVYRANQTQNLRAFGADAWAREMTVVGNVLEAHASAGFQPVYEKPTSTANINVPAVWDIGNFDRLGSGGGGGAYDLSSAHPVPNYGVAAGVVPNATYTARAIDLLFRHGNWDNVTNNVGWNPDTTDHALPDSLYLTSKPPFFGDLPWPWIDPTGASAAERVRLLPSQQRYTAMLAAAATTYAAWRQLGFIGADLANDTVSGPAADPDGAGLNNYARYAFALAARGPVAAPITSGTADDSGQRYLTLTFPRRATAPDLSYVVEASADLATWATVATYGPDAASPVTHRDTVALNSAPRRFVRVRVIQP